MKTNKKNRIILTGMIVFLLIIGGAGYGYLHTLDDTQKVAMLPATFTNSVLKHANNDDKKDIIKKAQKSVYTIFTDDGMGSGFLFEEKGTVVTNAHVVAGFTDVTVRNSLGQDTPGRIIGISKFFDVALIQVDAYEGETPLPIGNEFMELGSEIIALGSPQGLENSASVGYLTGLDRTLEDTDYNYGEVYQIDAQIYPGSSGGPLLDAKTGEVIGINSGLLIEDDTIGFAIPISAMEVLLKKWSNSPMTEEEVAKVVPSGDDEEDFEFGEDASESIFEVSSLTNFVQYFRSSYEIAIEEEDFYYIIDMLGEDSEAYQKLEEAIVLIGGNGSKFELTSNEVTNVVIKNDHAIVNAVEVYDSISPQGERSTFKKQKDYTIIFDEYGFYTITKISSY
ncbi:S1C family serine protease [Paenisporosarcina sp. NPDC076898]|uniref:S1C family serine protease n=1 Tax=unclassified Paenisporosarcina TaxID=2642018 RepID=UPI003D01FDA0